MARQVTGGDPTEGAVPQDHVTGPSENVSLNNLSPVLNNPGPFITKFYDPTELPKTD